MKEADILLMENDRSSAILVWWDTIDDGIAYFSKDLLRPWQVVNRLPSINLICRKAGLARMIERIPPVMRHLFQFWPRTFVLPADKDKFMQLFEASETQAYIFKPDGGSLGLGIRIVRPGDKFSIPNTLTIAQEYIPPKLLNNKKFDLRVYVLIAQVDPLQVYVYRDGIARVCSKEYCDGKDRFSQITNTAVNRQNGGVAIGEITRLISDVFGELQRTENVIPAVIWSRIDYAIVCTIAAAWGYLREGEERLCPPSPYSRCFQVLGFDVLLDAQMSAHILEVNYRPSLGADIPEEKTLKTRMLKEAVQIAAPHAPAQQKVDELPKGSRKERDDNWANTWQMPQKMGELIDSTPPTEPRLFKRVFPGGAFDRTVKYICAEVQKIGVGIVGGLPQLGLPRLGPETVPRAGPPTQRSQGKAAMTGLPKLG
jgi:hypothetical protein